MKAILVRLVLIISLLLNGCSSVTKTDFCSSLKSESNKYALAGYSLSWISSDGSNLSCNSEGVSPTTAFEAASLSKPVFSVIVNKLINEGRLSLDSKLIDLIDVQQLPVRFQNIYHQTGFEKLTVRHILVHKSGLPNWRDKRGLHFSSPPGQSFTYSGEAYELLQSVVEITSNKSLQQLASDYIFKPLNMRHTSYISGSIEPIAGTSITGQRLPLSNHRLGSAAYSLVTTSSDYLNFLRGLMAGEILPMPQVETMLQVQSKEYSNEISADWGLGIIVERVKSSQFILHTGSNPGFRALALIDTDVRSGLVYLSNSERGSVLDQWLVESITSLPINSNLYQWLECSGCIYKSRLIRSVLNDGVVSEDLPQDIDLMADVAYELAEYGDYKRASNIYSKLKKLNYDAVEIAYGEGIASLRMGDLITAREKLSYVLSVNPEAENAAKIFDGLDTLDSKQGIKVFLQGHDNAYAVFLSGDFNGWHRFSLPMKRIQGGWVRYITPEVEKSRYIFRVDNDWIIDSTTTQKESFFGKPVSVLRSTSPE
ncbi:serine hydrolase [Rheinheimera sp. FR7-31]|uniref:serine hydrolase n=1 Tax=Rheinheimera fenheensis TaxID=3152295 RepID=UPI00325E11C5